MNNRLLSCKKSLVMFAANMYQPKLFSRTMIGLIVLHSIILSTAYHGMSEKHEQILSTATYVITGTLLQSHCLRVLGVCLCVDLECFYFAGYVLTRLGIHCLELLLAIIALGPFTAMKKSAIVLEILILASYGVIWGLRSKTHRMQGSRFLC